MERKSYRDKNKGSGKKDVEEYKKKLKNIGVTAILGIVIFSGILMIVFFSDVFKGHDSCVAVIHINGEITMQRSPGSLLSPGSPNAEDIANAIEKADKKSNVKAILLDIDSPGGSVIGSRLIRHAMDKSDKPIVSYLGEMAASGGYYIASGSDYIVSDPNTLTGSIGVITMFVDASDLLAKLGINVTAVTTGEHKTMGAFFKKFNDSDKAIIESIINETYKEFISVVEEGRGSRLNRKAFLSIADGRVLSGRQAKAIGMVDKLGYKEDALEEAAELGNISYDKEVPTCSIEVTPKNGEGLGLETDVGPINEVLSVLKGGIKLI